MMYVPKHFKPQELLDKVTFERFGNWGLRYFREGLLQALDWIWENYPAGVSGRGVLVNAWSIGGTTQWRGLRSPTCPEYKPHSAHSFGAAVDITAKGINADDLRAWIQSRHAHAVQTVKDWTEAGMMYETPPILHIRRMEIGTPTWVHIDVLEHDSPNLLMVNP